MEFSGIESFVDECESSGSDEIGFCDQHSFSGENMADAAPGGYLNPFGYFVIGTTIGGNTIVISDSDPRVLFADHTWYGDNDINYQDHAGDGKWHELRTLTLALSKMFNVLYINLQ